MIKPLQILILLFSVAAIPIVHSAPIERVIWDKRPIPVVLAVGQERLIHFPGDIRYWLPDALKNAVTVLAANGVLYLQSERLFIKTRLRVQEVDTQRVYLLDIVSQEKGDYSQDIVVTPQSDVVNLSPSAKPSRRAVDWPITLMRFAAQTLYAPERLSPTDQRIRRVSVNAAPVKMLRGGQTESTPLGQWQGGGFYVTALLVRNLSSDVIEIVPVKHSGDRVEASIDIGRTLSLSHDIRGQWLYAATQHSVLYPAGRDADRTCLYVVSRRPFEGSL